MEDGCSGGMNRLYYRVHDQDKDKEMDKVTKLMQRIWIRTRMKKTIRSRLGQGQDNNCKQYDSDNDK